MAYDQDELLSELNLLRANIAQYHQDVEKAHIWIQRRGTVATEAGEYETLPELAARQKSIVDQIDNMVQGSTNSDVIAALGTLRAEVQASTQAALAEAEASLVGVVEGAVAAAEAEVDGYISGARSEQSHYRLTKNQALVPNADNSFPLHFSAGYVKRATPIEYVETAVNATERSELAREFLRAINSDSTYFAGGFWIWEIEAYPNKATTGSPNTHSHFGPYQYVRSAQNITSGAIVKHISGTVPSASWCSGLKANEVAKVCGSHINFGDGLRNGYTQTTAKVNGEGLPETETTVIQCALIGTVTGHVDLNSGWGQFPLIGAKDADGERVFD